ncbi:MAG: VanZ family protein [Eubacteriales bacterium]|nr:VanZ family protein [Eubacteriales bacterium]
MSLYIEPILTAAWIFPFVAAFITLPYMLVQYRRYGAILLLRTVILYSFILYLMCAYFLTMLPLPDPETVASLTTPYLQLEPFKDVVTWVQKSGFVLSQPSTWPGLLINRDLFAILANIVMTIPLGIYLRYYFGCSWKKTLLISLGVSLVFELTQLSALFGIYPRPYRLCETDDLITNTLGGLIGYRIAKPLMRFLPSRERMDEIAYVRGTHVSVTRRVTAAIVDWMLLGAILLLTLVFDRPLQTLLIGNSVSVWVIVFGVLYVLLVTLYFMLGEWLQKGLTLGKRLTHIRLVDARDGSRPKLWQCAVRYSLLYFGFAPLPFVALLFFFGSIKYDDTKGLWLTLCILLILLYVACVVWMVIGVLNRSSQLPHGELSKTSNISTVRIKDDLLSKLSRYANEDRFFRKPRTPGGPMAEM